MMVSLSGLLVGLAIAAVVVAEADYPAPCYPETIYLTKYLTQVQQVSAMAG